jgi:hypothetical protein
MIESDDDAQSRRPSRHTVAMTMNPREVLERGAAELAEVLGPAGFAFIAVDDEDDGGGPSASGEFRRGERSLELRVRRSLSLVRYHFGEESLSHEDFVVSGRSIEYQRRLNTQDSPTIPPPDFVTFASISIGSAPSSSPAARRPSGP